MCTLKPVSKCVFVNETVEGEFVCVKESVFVFIRETLRHQGGLEVKGATDR